MDAAATEQRQEVTMLMKLCVAGVSAAAIVLATTVVSSDALAQGQSRAATTKKAAKNMGRFPTTMAPPRTRITVRRSYLDAGTHVIRATCNSPTTRSPGYSPTSVIEHRSGVYSTALPGPFTLPGRDNPYPWNWCVGC
jgi:hypothetical protein